MSKVLEHFFHEDAEGEIVFQLVGDKASVETTWQPFHSYKGGIKTAPAPPEKQKVG